MHEPTIPPPDSPTRSIDLTTTPSSQPRGPLPPHMSKFSPHLRTPFSSAHRRIHYRRERIYSRTNPDIGAERLDISEEAPYSSLREKALAHISFAYAAAGYAHAALCIVVSLALAALVLGFGRGLYADIVRKTRIRADEIAIHAAECYLERVRNNCQISDIDEVTHSTPALDTLCKKWVACERRGKHADADAYSASVWAETVAETVNSFAERISSTVVVIGFIVVIMVLFMMSSAAFGFMHRKVAGTNLDRSVTGEIMQREPVFRGNGQRAIAYGENIDANASPRR